MQMVFSFSIITQVIIKILAISLVENGEVIIAEGQFFKMAASRLASFCRCVGREN